MWLIDQIPGFIVGALAGGITVFFVYHNNQKKANELFDKAKAEFDEKEKMLRAEAEELKFEEKIKALLVKWGVVK